MALNHLLAARKTGSPVLSALITSVNLMNTEEHLPPPSPSNREHEQHGILNEKHWHGASLTIAMTHIAMQEELSGKVVDWMEKVTEEQYISKSNQKVN